MASRNEFEDQVVCATCRRPLDRFEGAGVDEVRWLHPLTAPDDHPPMPVSRADTGGEIVGRCDFCSEPHPLWAYPCAAFTVGTYASSGAWAACERCHQLIESRQYQALAVRCTAGLPRAAARAARADIARLHRRFSRNRTGPAFRL